MHNTHKGRTDRCLLLLHLFSQKPNKNTDVKREILFNCHDGEEEEKNKENFCSILHIYIEKQKKTTLHCTAHLKKRRFNIHTHQVCHEEIFVPLQINERPLRLKK